MACSPPQSGCDPRSHGIEIAELDDELEELDELGGHGHSKKNLKSTSITPPLARTLISMSWSPGVIANVPEFQNFVRGGLSSQLKSL